MLRSPDRAVFLILLWLLPWVALHGPAPPEVFRLTMLFLSPPLRADGGGHPLAIANRRVAHFRRERGRSRVPIHCFPRVGVAQRSPDGWRLICLVDLLYLCPPAQELPQPLPRVLLHEQLCAAVALRKLYRVVPARAPVALRNSCEPLSLVAR